VKIRRNRAIHAQNSWASEGSELEVDENQRHSLAPRVPPFAESYDATNPVKC
jgi:hypothetical protein